LVPVCWQRASKNEHRSDQAQDLLKRNTGEIVRSTPTGKAQALRPIWMDTRVKFALTCRETANYRSVYCPWQLLGFVLGFFCNMRRLFAKSAVIRRRNPSIAFLQTSPLCG
jgi:hypothetical protein